MRDDRPEAYNTSWRSGGGAGGAFAGANYERGYASLTNPAARVVSYSQCEHAKHNKTQTPIIHCTHMQTTTTLHNRYYGTSQEAGITVRSKWVGRPLRGRCGCP